MRTFKIKTEAGVVSVDAEDVCKGVLLNPVLPKQFGMTPNEDRSEKERALWWGRPYIQSYTVKDEVEYQEKYQAERALLDPSVDVKAVVEEMRQGFLTVWPGGIRYTVYCLDGGAWDRSTWWGAYDNLEQALECAELGPERRRILA